MTGQSQASCGQLGPCFDSRTMGAGRRSGRGGLRLKLRGGWGRVAGWHTQTEPGRPLGLQAGPSCRRNSLRLLPGAHIRAPRGP